MLCDCAPAHKPAVLTAQAPIHASLYPCGQKRESIDERGGEMMPIQAPAAILQPCAYRLLLFWNMDLLKKRLCLH